MWGKVPGIDYSKLDQKTLRKLVIVKEINNGKSVRAFGLAVLGLGLTLHLAHLQSEGMLFSQVHGGVRELAAEEAKDRESKRDVRAKSIWWRWWW